MNNHAKLLDKNAVLFLSKPCHLFMMEERELLGNFCALAQKGMKVSIRLEAEALEGKRYDHESCNCWSCRICGY